MAKSTFPKVSRGILHAYRKKLACWKRFSSKLRIYNCHFESYNISLPAIIKRHAAVEETERKLRHSITERPRQVAQVLTGIDQAPVHSIVVGDFNDTPLSYTYFRLIRGRKDSFMKAGKGFGATCIPRSCRL